MLNKSVFSQVIRNFCKTIKMIERLEKFSVSERTDHEFIDRSHVLTLEEKGIVQCGIATCRDEFTIARRNQQKHMLLYTVKGRGWLTSGGIRYELEPGSVISVPAGIDNAFGIEEQDWQIAWVFLDPLKAWPSIDLSLVRLDVTPISEVMYAAVLGLLRTISLPIALGSDIAIRSVEQIELLINAPAATDSNRLKTRLNQLFANVQRQLHKDWSVEQLAEMMPCSEPHFHRLCQQYLGHSPKVHLTRMRMEYAARLLVSTQWSVQHIGEIVGYPNAANFSTRFKKWSQLTPRSFRNKFA